MFASHHSSSHFDQIEEIESQNTVFAANHPDRFAEMADTLDEATCPVFAGCIIPFVLDQVHQVTMAGTALPADLLNGLGAGWNFFDGIAGTALAVQMFRDLPEKQRRVKEEAAWASMYLTTSTALNVGTVLTLLAQYNVVHGMVAAAFSPIGGIAFAACMWGAAIHSYVKLGRAVREANDNVYWFNDLITRITKLQNKINKIEEEENYTWDDNKLELFEKLKAQQAVLINQARVVYVNASPSQQNKMKDVVTNISTADILVRHHDWVDKVVENNMPSETDRAVYSTLKKSKQNDVNRHIISSLNWTMAAIGMTLIAVAPFTGPAAPIVATVGVAISAVAGAMKLAEYVIPRVTNRIARNKHMKRNPALYKTIGVSMFGGRYIHKKKVLKDKGKLIRQAAGLGDNVRVSDYLSDKEQQDVLRRAYKRSSLPANDPRYEFFTQPGGRREKQSLIFPEGEILTSEPSKHKY